MELCPGGFACKIGKINEFGFDVRYLAFKCNNLSSFRHRAKTFEFDLLLP